MNWIIISILLFCSSILTYISLRKSQLNLVSNSHNNLAMFALPTIIFFLIAFLQKLTFNIPTQQLLIISLAGFFLSYLGNISSLKGIQTSPNPGYSLIISKSYVIFTTLVAVLVFKSTLTLKNTLAIALIILFSAVIMINKTSNKSKNTDIIWIFYSLGAFFAWGCLALVSKYLIDQGINIIIYLFYLGFFVTLFIILEILLNKKIQSITLNSNTIIVLLGIGIGSTFLNLFMQFGYKLAPNPGYINAVNASSISIVTLFSAYFFKDELNKRKIIGIIGITFGLIMLFI